MLKIKSLTKAFGDKMAVRDVSFQIKPGEIFALIGPNGSGKTTIIKTVAGLLKPTSGEVIVCNQNVVDHPENAKACLGYIPDDPYIWPTMTGNEFLHFVGALYGMAEKDRTDKIKELLPVFNIDQIKDEYFEDYSRGNKQKFSIIAALLHEPKVLLVDEPIVGLDPDSAIIAKSLFLSFTKKGGAVLLVTHTLSVAQEIAHQIGILKSGSLIASGDVRQLSAKASLKKGASLEDIYLTLT